MGDIGKILNESIKGFEAPYSSDMWDKISGQLSPMEDAFRDSVDGHEAPYNPASWDAIKGQIGSSSAWKQWVVGSAAAITLVVGGVSLFSSNTTEEISNAEKQLVSNNENALIVFDLNKDKNHDFTPNYSSQIFNENDTNYGNEENGSTIDPNQSEPVNGNDLIAGNDTNNSNDTDNSGTSASNEGNANSSGVDPVDVDNNNTTAPIAYSADFSVSTFEACQGEEILFNPKVIKNSSKISYNWTFGDESVMRNSTSPTHSYETPGTYTVQLVVKDRVSNEIYASEENTIVIHEAPKSNFTWKQNNELIPTVQFAQNENQEGIWKINGSPVSDKGQFEYTFRDKGEYQVSFESTNEFGCSSSYEENIQIEKDYNLLAPTAFTPNGNSTNETFIPIALTLMEKEFTMIIYSEDSRMVYQTANAFDPWAGQNITDNSLAPSGAYVWVVQLKNGNGQTEHYKGQVFLIR